MLAEIPLLVGGELDFRLSLVQVASSTKEGDLDLFLAVAAMVPGDCGGFSDMLHNLIDRWQLIDYLGIFQVLANRFGLVRSSPDQQENRTATWLVNGRLDVDDRYLGWYMVVWTLMTITTQYSSRSDRMGRRAGARGGGGSSISVP